MATSKSARRLAVNILKKKEHVVDVNRNLRRVTTLVHKDKSSVTDSDIKPFSAIPGPSGLPYFGSYFRYKLGFDDVMKFKDVLMERYKQYGPIVKETVAGNTIVYVFHPELVKAVYAKDGKDPYVPPLLQERKTFRKTNKMSPGLGNTNGVEWLRLRSAANQMMMRPLAAAEFLPATNRVVDDFISRIKTIIDIEGEVPDFENELSKWLLEGSGQTVFDRRLGCLEAGPDSLPQKLIDANMTTLQTSVKIKFSLPFYKILPTTSITRFNQAEEMFFGKGQELVDETVQHIRNLSARGELKDGQFRFLAHLLSRDELSYSDVSIVTLSSFGDGLTTNLPITIQQLYCLAKHPDVQEMAHEEIKRVVPQEGAVTLDMINELRYLKACFKEGIRLFPLQTDVQRIAKTDFTLGGYHIPAGTILALANNIMLRSEDFVRDPEVYTPERWLRQSRHVTNMHPYLMIPFSHGARMCIGRRLAEQEIYTFLCRLLQNFRLEWAGDDVMGQKFNIVLWPDRKPRFRFIRR